MMANVSNRLHAFVKETIKKEVGLTVYSVCNTCRHYQVVFCALGESCTVSCCTVLNSVCTWFLFVYWVNLAMGYACKDLAYIPFLRPPPPSRFHSSSPDKLN
uniref:Uncharacterized protein n=1 Tax=Helianthus annuus TaxID=4232 RepID=A0A251UH04_HELAN